MQSSRAGSGLHNLGNTCFFNAVMQIILYTPPLIQCFKTNRHSSTCTKSDWCIFCAIQKLWHSSKKSRVVSPNDIVSNLRFIFKKFRLGRQQDSHEFLRYLVEGIQQAETGKLGKERQKNQKAIIKTTTYHTFGGKMRTFVLCLNCHHKSLTNQRYYDLSIQCQKSNTLLQGLQNYFKVDDLMGSNKYKCDSCKQLSNAKKGFKIISLPSVITFQFKRFTNSLRKIGKLIEYPKTINLNRFMENQQQDSEFGKLQLYGVIVHSGSSAGSGHYYAFVKNGSDWFEMNDSNVSRCNQDRVLRQQAYLLFYRRVREETVSEVGNMNQNQETDEILTNIKLNLEQKARIQRSQTAQKTQKQKKQQEKQEKPRKKSKQYKPRKQSEQVMQQTKRKLSLDIENLKQQAREQQNLKNSQDKNENISKQKNKPQINGKKLSNMNPKQHIKQNGKVDEHIQSHNHKHLNGKTIQIIQQKINYSDDEDIEPPPKLQRRKSRQQALMQLTTMEAILSYAQKINNLTARMPRTRHNRALRSVSNLRKFQIRSKRRRIIT